MFTNRIQPFRPQGSLRLAMRPAVDVEMDVVPYDEFGFKEGSKQARFFESTAANRVVAFLYEDAGTEAPRSLLDPRVVARLFGTQDRDGSLELWHLSVHQKHPLNDSGKGTRWGVHGVVKDTSGHKVRWKSVDGATLTSQTAAAHVRGTPNPYAVDLLVRTVERLACPSVRQHDDMPCAKLFHKDYDHATHPATQLIYRSLKFIRGSGVLHYTWLADRMPPLRYSYDRLLESMRCGTSAVP